MTHQKKRSVQWNGGGKETDSAGIPVDSMDHEKAETVEKTEIPDSEIP
jgi:hypothetical protein